MFSIIKSKLAIYVVAGILAALAVFFNPYVITKKSVLEKYETDRFNDSTSIAKLGVELKDKDVQIFSIQQDLDICNNNKANHQTVISQLTKERNEARAEAKLIREAIEHYEANDLMRFFVYDPKGWFQKGCFKEVEKPDNICK